MLTSPITMVIIGENPQERTRLRMQLLSSGKVHVVAETSDFARGTDLIQEYHPDSALILINGDNEKPLDLVRQINKRDPATAVVCTGSDCPSSVIVQSYRSGATEFLCQPLKQEEIEEVLAKIESLRGGDEAQTKVGKVIALYSSRGGTGVTTLGVNLAATIIRTLEEKVVLVDLNLQYGALPLFFGLDPEYTIADVVRNQDRLDAQLLKSFLMRTSDNLYCLPAPLRVEEADDVQPGHIQRIISMLRAQFAYILIDCHHLLDANTVTALDLADLILLVSLVDVPSVYCTKRVLEVFEKMGFTNDKVRVIVNRYDKRDGIPLDKVKEVFDSDIEMMLTEDYRAALASINLGSPLVVSQPKSPLIKQYRDLVSRIAGQSVEKARGKRWSLFSW